MHWLLPNALACLDTQYRNKKEGKILMGKLCFVTMETYFDSNTNRKITPEVKLPLEP